MDAAKPLRADAQRNRDAIIAAARTVLETEDSDLRFDDFAPLAGVGTGTLYRHFPNREALMVAVYQEDVATLCDRARTLQEALPGAEALAVFLRSFVEFIESRHALTRTLTALMSTRADEFAQGSRALEQAVTQLVAAGVEDGTVRNDVSAGAVMVALHGVGGARDRPDWRAEADGVITVLIDGLRAPL